MSVGTKKPGRFPALFEIVLSVTFVLSGVVVVFAPVTMFMRMYGGDPSATSGDGTYGSGVLIFVLSAGFLAVCRAIRAASSTSAVVVDVPVVPPPLPAPASAVVDVRSLTPLSSRVEPGTERTFDVRRPQRPLQTFNDATRKDGGA